MQRTTLEKHRGADAWPILGGEALKVQDAPFGVLEGVKIVQYQAYLVM
jgi:hypothetical protein